MIPLLEVPAVYSLFSQILSLDLGSDIRYGVGAIQ